LIPVFEAEFSASSNQNQDYIHSCSRAISSLLSVVKLNRVLEVIMWEWVMENKGSHNPSVLTFLLLPWNLCINLRQETVCTSFCFHNMVKISLYLKKSLNTSYPFETIYTQRLGTEY